MIYRIERCLLCVSHHRPRDVLRNAMHFGTHSPTSQESIARSLDMSVYYAVWPGVLKPYEKIIDYPSLTAPRSNSLLIPQQISLMITVGWVHG